MIRPELMIGAQGWEHTAWSGSFYPDDLPPEWRLTYYANEFPLLLVPLEVWRTGDEERFRSWYEDVSGRFRFVLDFTAADPADGESLQRLERCRSALGERLAGAVCWTAPSATEHARWRVGLGVHGMLATALEVPQMPSGVRLASDATTLCALVPSEAAGDLKWLRSVLESLAAWRAETGRLLLFFSGSPPRIQVMQEAAQLWQLLGGRLA